MAEVEISLEHQEVVDAINIYLKEKLGTEDYKHYKFEIVKEFPDKSINEIRMIVRTSFRNLKGMVKR
jgi:hypothetical protein